MPDGRAAPRLRARFLRYSIGLHLVGAATLAWNPSTWPLVVTGIGIDHLLMVGGSLWPRSQLVGPNLVRLPALAAEGQVALTFDDGPDPEITPRVLELLDRHQSGATFFMIGRRAERYPELVRSVVTAGHRVENHTYRHSNGFCFLGPRSLGRELDRAQRVLARQAGTPPRYFRAPAGLRNPWLDAVLVSRELELVSWTRRGFDTVSTDASRIVARLTKGIAAGDVILLHDGYSAKDRSGRPVVLDALARLLDELRARPGIRSPALVGTSLTRSDHDAPTAAEGLFEHPVSSP